MFRGSTAQHALQLAKVTGGLGARFELDGLVRKMLEHPFPAGGVRIEILAKPDRGEGNTGSVLERSADRVEALSLGRRDPPLGAIGNNGQLSKARGGILQKTAVPSVKVPCVEPAQEALCRSQGIDGKGSREGRYAGVRFVKHAEEGAHSLDAREGFAEQAGVELEEPEQAGGADTEFSEPVPALAGHPVEAEAEGDLNLHETSLARGRMLSIEAGEASVISTWAVFLCMLHNSSSGSE